MYPGGGTPFSPGAIAQRNVAAATRRLAVDLLVDPAIALLLRSDTAATLYPIAERWFSNSVSYLANEFAHSLISRPCGVRAWGPDGHRSCQLGTQWVHAADPARAKKRQFHLEINWLGDLDSNQD